VETGEASRRGMSSFGGGKTARKGGWEKKRGMGGELSREQDRPLAEAESGDPNGKGKLHRHL